MTTRLFLASTLYGAATLAAALDAGCFGPADRRILLVSNNAATPETTPSVDEMPGFAPLRSRFDDVVSWNATVFPFHPGAWSPRPDDEPLWERHLRLAWGIGDDDLALTVESLQVDPALGLARVFTDAPLTVYADGLMSYGPTRNKLDPLVGTRVERLLHLDLVPGLRPLLLTEFDVPAEVVPTAAFTEVLAELAEAAEAADAAGAPVPAELPTAADPTPQTAQAAQAAQAGHTAPAMPASPASPGAAAPAGPALLLGQYLSALGILTAEEEEHLHVRMLRGAAGLGHTRAVFKPHPTAPARFTRTLEEEAERLGVRLTVVDTPVLAEVLYQRLRPALVVGCFSTALLTASAFYGLPVARVGTDTLLERLRPYENSNRVPVTVVDALLPAPDDVAAVAAGRGALDTDALADLVRAVGFAMQPRLLPDLRAETERYLATRLDARTRRYFTRKRLTALGLPGGVPARLAFLPRNATVRRAARTARRLRRAVARG
ncbi:polysialyltransferase family glycosyltransferase [Streptomyces sp. bgisy022]|uniref:polysialyltransferase family glycosyltransferase n=1 Tax=Streptomyces sp. bgisy022 TaxID=3413769 RepID=UPI003D74E04B